MKSLLGITFVFIGFSTAAQDTWVQKDSVNGSPRSVASVFMLDDDAYTAGGLDEGGFRRKMYSYTYSQDDWDTEESIGGANGAGLNRGSAAAFSIGDKAYIVGGQGETVQFLADTWEFDVTTQLWTQRADFGGGPRRQTVYFSANDKGYVGLGSSPTGLKKDMYTYNPVTNVWTQLNDFPGTARKEAVGFMMGSNAYVGTGDDGVLKKDFWEYNPFNDSWLQRADFPGTPRKGAVGWGIFPDAFICTGEDINFEFKKDLWQYNYFTNSWQQRADFPGPGRSNAIAFVLEGFGFVGTGYDGIFYDDLYAYAPILSTPEHTLAEQVSVFPNPTHESFSIESELKQLSLQLYSSDGKEVTDFVEIQQQANGTKIERNGLPNGTYILEIKDQYSNTTTSKKVIFN